LLITNNLDLLAGNVKDDEDSEDDDFEEGDSEDDEDFDDEEEGDEEDGDGDGEGEGEGEEDEAPTTVFTKRPREDGDKEEMNKRAVVEKSNKKE
jgi:hypothetical protein